MTDRLFILTFDTTDPQLDLLAMKSLLDESDAVKGWWNHIPGVFFLESPLNARELADKVKARVGRVRFVTVEARPDQMNGLLPAQSWEWLVKRSQAARKLQPAASS